MPKARSRPPKNVKTTKIEIRLRANQMSLLVRAAKLRQTTLRNFLVESACTAAQQVLAEQAQFILPLDRWEAFCKALDAPPRAKPALKTLLRAESLFGDPPPAAAQ